MDNGKLYLQNLFQRSTETRVVHLLYYMTVKLLLDSGDIQMLEPILGQVVIFRCWSLYWDK